MTHHIAEDPRKVLGQVLRQRRQALKLTRKDLYDRLFNRLGVDVSLQALATYEHGTRACSVSRFIELCCALDVRPLEMWSQIEAQLMGAHNPASVTVDLCRIELLERPDLVPVRAWARQRLLNDPERPIVELTVDALTSLAAVCQLGVDELAIALRDA